MRFWEFIMCVRGRTSSYGTWASWRWACFLWSQAGRWCVRARLFVSSQIRLWVKTDDLRSLPEPSHGRPSGSCGACGHSLCRGRDEARIPRFGLELVACGFVHAGKRCSGSWPTSSISSIWRRRLPQAYGPAHFDGDALATWSLDGVTYPSPSEDGSSELWPGHLTHPAKRADSFACESCRGTCPKHWRHGRALSYPAIPPDDDASKPALSGALSFCGSRLPLHVGYRRS